MDTVATPAAIVRAYCKVCKSIVDHTIVSMRGQKPGRVRCGVCEDAHSFHAKVPAPRKAHAAAPPGVVQEPASYDSLVQGRDLSQSTRYMMSHVFANSELVDHDKFGIGLVMRVLMNRKIEVLFPDGMKLLVHNR